MCRGTVFDSRPREGVRYLLYIKQGDPIKDYPGLDHGYISNLRFPTRYVCILKNRSLGNQKCTVF
jgi:hypothetical protein